MTNLTRSASAVLPALDTPRRLAARIETPGSTFMPASPGVLADGILATLHPAVEAVHSRTRRGRRALWGTVTDMVAAAFHRVGDHLGQPSEARHHASTVIGASQTLVGGANWHPRNQTHPYPQHLLSQARVTLSTLCGAATTRCGETRPRTRSEWGVHRAAVGVGRPRRG